MQDFREQDVGNTDFCAIFRAISIREWDLLQEAEGGLVDYPFAAAEEPFRPVLEINDERVRLEERAFGSVILQICWLLRLNKRKTRLKTIFKHAVSF
jgi:hypothetical protein